VRGSCLVTGAAVLAGATVVGAVAGCKARSQGRVATFVRPPLPAGFSERKGTGWRLGVPTTWDIKAQDAGELGRVYEDPQPADDYRANASVVSEPFAGESLGYARALEATLRDKTSTSIEVAREDVVDGDATLVVEARATSTPPKAVAFRVMQVGLAARGRGYVVTCAASNDAFERYRSTCDAIVRSFAIER